MQKGRVQLVKLFLIGGIGCSSHNKGIPELTAHHSFVCLTVGYSSGWACTLRLLDYIHPTENVI